MKSTAKAKSRPKGSIEAIELPNPNGIDLLILALGRIGGKGGAARAASELGITVRKVYSILQRGVGHLPFRQVVDISKRSGIPVHLLRTSGLPEFAKAGKSKSATRKKAS
jgi:hypothetical protein